MAGIRHLVGFEELGGGGFGALSALLMVAEEKVAEFYRGGRSPPWSGTLAPVRVWWLDCQNQCRFPEPGILPPSGH